MDIYIQYIVFNANTTIIKVGRCIFQSFDFLGNYPPVYTEKITIILVLAIYPVYR